MRFWALVRKPFTAISFLLMCAAFALAIHSFRADDITGWFRNEWTGDDHLILARYTLGAHGGQFFFRAVRIDENWGPFGRTSRTNSCEYHMLSEYARTAFAKFRNDTPECAQWKFVSSHAPVTSSARLFNDALFGFEKLNEPVFASGGTVAVPAWFVIALLAILPARYLDRCRRKTNTPPQSSHASFALA